MKKRIEEYKCLVKALNEGDILYYFRCRNELLDLLKKEGITEPLYFHTDQGAVFSSISFNQALFNHNIIR